ncbi:hypothetical protein [Piscibacillus salipiscarius]|uniref:Replication initiation protein n=1 Tax=Piscibacillus salipiscarius TaxID=299480 RepID=A0ABW5Q8C7_9BACI|nr:hypothetical protein [Piscibacillus salipiscarius]
MIHTFSFYVNGVNNQDLQQLFTLNNINLNQFTYIKAAVEKLNQRLKQKLNQALVISSIIFNCDNDWTVKCKVDVTKLLSRGTIKETDYHEVERILRTFFDQYCGSAEYFDQHVLTRIDYKYDICIPSATDRKLLFFLFEKYTSLYRFKVKVKWGKDENGKPLKYETSQYHKNNSVQIIVYDKEAERRANNEIILPYERNILRYELRLHNQHLNSMKREDSKGHSQSKKLSVYFVDSMWEYYMKKNILSIFRLGDFYKVYEAKKVVKNSSYTRNRKEKLIKFLTTVSKGTIDTPKKHMSAPTYRQIIKDLESIDVNPVLIPKNRKDFPPYFKNPFQI